jgi:phosphoribosylaminoimidazole carboxylase PurE protein
MSAETSKGKAIWIIGSKADEKLVIPGIAIHEYLGIPYDLRVSSAHKTPRNVLDIISRYNTRKDPTVYLACVGGSPALGGMVAVHARFPTISVPLEEKYLQEMLLAAAVNASGVAPLVSINVKNAALSSAIILGMSNAEIEERTNAYRKTFPDTVRQDDPVVRRGIRKNVLEYLVEHPIK